MIAEKCKYPVDAKKRTGTPVRWYFDYCITSNVEKLGIFPYKNNGKVGNILANSNSLQLSIHHV